MLLMAKKSDTEQICFRMSTQLLDRVEKIGEQMFGLRRSQLIHRAVEEWVLRQEEQLRQQQQPPKQPQRH
jgi:metal-responsive CopG/Arc/MetJ family transcriptional regulator